MDIKTLYQEAATYLLQQIKDGQHTAPGAVSILEEVRQFIALEGGGNASENKLVIEYVNIEGGGDGDTKSIT